MIRDTWEPRDTLDTRDTGYVFVPELENEEGVEPPRALPDTGASAALEDNIYNCLLYTSPSPRDGLLSRMPSSA